LTHLVAASYSGALPGAVAGLGQVRRNAEVDDLLGEIFLTTIERSWSQSSPPSNGVSALISTVPLSIFTIDIGA
jgi:hypothetical protein